MHKRLLSFLFLSSALGAGAQNFHWESKIDPVGSNGYYKILLAPDVSSQLRDGFPDVRIFDKENSETPYLIFKDVAKKGVDRFITYQIVEKNYSYYNSFITVKNTIGDPIDHIVLEVNNAESNRRMHLTGSYDGNEWFAVKDEFSIVNFNGYDKGVRRTTNLLRFDFPLTDYKFYRFEIGDWHWWWRSYKAPIFVVRAGYVEPTFIPEACIELPSAKVTQENDVKKKTSTVHIVFDEPQYIDHLNFVVNNGEEKADYFRSASLYERTYHKNDSLHPYQDRFIASTILSSLNPNEIGLGKSRVKELVLVVSNEDDKPLQIPAVKAFQVKYYLVSKLSAGDQYVMRFGSDSVNAPVYDMKYFADKIPDSSKVINTAARLDIFQRPVEEQKTAKAEPFFKSTGFIWGAIAVVILLLAFVSLRMLREMKK